MYNNVSTNLFIKEFFFLCLGKCGNTFILEVGPRIKPNYLHNFVF
jgi:hypothetical protein